MGRMMAWGEEATPEMEALIDRVGKRLADPSSWATVEDIESGNHHGKLKLISDPLIAKALYEHDESFRAYTHEDWD